METIKNSHPEITTQVDLCMPCADLCPHSHEPQPGSTIEISYFAKDQLIELHAIEKWLQEQAKSTDPMDLETLAQRLTIDAHAALGGGYVQVKAAYILKSGIQMAVYCGKE